MMFNVLGERLEFSFPKQSPRVRSPSQPGAKLRTVVFPQVLDFCRGMLVVDLPALLTAHGRPVQVY